MMEMSLESQNIEYKQSWRDEYLKWVCGFANGQGGKIYIGKDDNGATVGVEDAKRLSEDIPNKTLWNLGQLPDSLTAEGLTQFHASYPRNPLIAGACFKATLIDSWGSGISKIMTACKNEGLPEPRFEAFGGGVLVTLFREPDGIGQTIGQESEASTSQKTDTETSTKTPQKTPQKTLQKTPQKILDLIKKNPNITTREMAISIGIDRSNIARAIKKLQERGLIRRVGPDKGGHWEIIENENNK